MLYQLMKKILYLLLNIDQEFLHYVVGLRGMSWDWRKILAGDFYKKIW